MAPERRSAAAAHFNRGNALLADGKPAAAESWYRQALALDPRRAAFHINLGLALREQGRLEEAAASCRRAVAIDPGSADAHTNLGVILAQQGQFDRAIASYRRALSIDPGHSVACNNLGGAWKSTGRVADAVFCYRRALELAPQASNFRSDLLLCLQYDPTISAGALLLEHRAYGASLPTSEALPHCNARDPDKRLNIGYVSPDLRLHPVGLFLMPVLAMHDRARFKIHCYYGHRQHDGITAFLQMRTDVWRSTIGVADDELAATVRADGVDILVDLAGHTADNRLPVFARKPAPVQVSWGGYSGTTGVSAIDYLITDRWLSPPGTERYAVEQLVRLADGYLCWSIPDHAPEVGPLPATTPGAVTFACFNNLAKVNPPVIALWARLLRELPASRLVLKTRELGDAAARERLLELFAIEEIAASRLVLEGASPHPEYLERYREVDIALDPFPFSGGATTIDALWMGVPVVTLGGECFAARHSLSHLNVAGLGELVADGPEDYLRIAMGLAQDLPRLAALRAGMRDRLRASPLLRSRRFARGLEQAYRDMWKKWCQGGD